MNEQSEVILPNPIVRQGEIQLTHLHNSEEMNKVRQLLRQLVTEVKQQYPQETQPTSPESINRRIDAFTVFTNLKDYFSFAESIGIKIKPLEKFMLALSPRPFAGYIKDQSGQKRDFAVLLPRFLHETELFHELKHSAEFIAGLENYSEIEKSYQSRGYLRRYLNLSAATMGANLGLIAMDIVKLSSGTEPISPGFNVGLLSISLISLFHAYNEMKVYNSLPTEQRANLAGSGPSQAK